MTKRPRFGGFCECGDHAWAYVTQRFITLVSPEDAHLLNEKLWSSVGRPRHPYAHRKIGTAPRERRVFLHRVVTSAPEGLVVDHINGNSLDNRRSNLRICTHRENLRSQRRRGPLPKGVAYDRNKFVARLRKDGEAIRLGRFDTPAEAAAAYDEAAVKYFGEFALTNEAMGTAP